MRAHAEDADSPVISNVWLAAPVSVCCWSYGGMTMPATLSVEDVLHIHERVCRDFAESDDPVGMTGPRDRGLLESAVSRQHVGLGTTWKYPDPYENAATLTFGLCCGHPFHNGNKRTALVAMLAHLDRNGYSVFGINQRDLYAMIKAVATHRLGIRVPRRRRNSDYTRREADEEVAAIADWLRPRARRVKRGERQITYRQLRALLAARGYSLANPKNNSIGVYREVEIRRLPVVGKKRRDLKRIGTIGYPGDGKVVGVKDVKNVRRLCGLDEASGCDSDSFYEGADLIEPFINEYRGVLRRLSKE
jgi:death-on-curing family protein